MKTFRRKTYEIETPKLKGGQSVKFAVLTDLHGAVYGEENIELYQAILDEKPDAVLIVGDMIVRTDISTIPPAEKLVLKLAKKLPVYYAMGNHENVLLEREETADVYLHYERRLTDAGVCFLHNEHTGMEIRGSDFVFYGLEIPMIYYKKPRSPRLSLSGMEALLGIPHMDGVHVLLAHNPKYGNTYFSWGADVILCGHYHGGILRFSERRGLISPHYRLFPPYCCGDFHEGGSHMFVSAGLGEHTLPLRIRNPRELLLVVLKPSDAADQAAVP